MLIAKNSSREIVMAQTAEKGTAYFCPACKESLVLKKGPVKLPHFAHLPGSTDCQERFSEGETYEHLLGKLLLYETFGQEAHLEVFLPDLRQRPDLLWRGQAWEFQCSPLPFQRFEERSRCYQQQGYPYVWLLGSKLWPKNGLTQLQRGALHIVRGQIQLWGLDVKSRELVIFVPKSWHYKEGFLLDEIRRPLSYLRQPQLLCHAGQSVEPAWVVADYRHQLLQLLARQDAGIMRLQGYCYQMGRHLAYLPDHCYQDSPFFFYFGHELLLLRALLLVHSNYPEWRKAVTRLSLKFPYLQLSLEDYLLGIFLEGQQANKKQIVGDLSDNYDKLRNCEGIPLS